MDPPHENQGPSCPSHYCTPIRVNGHYQFPPTPAITRHRKPQSTMKRLWYICIPSILLLPIIVRDYFLDRQLGSGGIKEGKITIKSTPSEALIIPPTLNDSTLFSSANNLQAKGPLPKDAKIDQQLTESLSTIPLTLNPNAELYRDVQSAQLHLPSSSLSGKLEVHVTMAPNATCPQPYLMGRLSGPALIALDWESLNGSSESTSGTPAPTTIIGTVVGGRGTVPVSGRYYVELVSVYCSDYSKGSANIDFRKECVIDPGPALTGPGRLAYCEVDLTSSAAQNKDGDLLLGINQSIAMGMDMGAGYWYRDRSTNNHQSSPNNSSSASDPGGDMVPTRFQPQGCRQKNENGEFADHCADAISGKKFDDFSWRWLANETTSITQDSSNTSSTVCMIGWSHTRHLIGAFQSQGLPKKMNIELHWAKAKFPTDVGETFVQSLPKCQAVVVALGQWPGQRGVSFADFRSQTESMIRALSDGLPAAKILARSIHYNPLGDLISSCSPKRDFRSPALIDGYNRIIAEVCRSLATGPKSVAVAFVDTNHIVKPMWDAAPDWCHLLESVSKIESIYIAGVLSETLQRLL